MVLPAWRLRQPVSGGFASTKFRGGVTAVAGGGGVVPVFSGPCGAGFNFLVAVCAGGRRCREGGGSLPGARWPLVCVYWAGAASSHFCGRPFFFPGMCGGWLGLDSRFASLALMLWCALARPDALCCVLLCRAWLYCAVLGVPCSVVPWCALLWCAWPWCGGPRRAVRCRSVLHRVVWCRGVYCRSALPGRALCCGVLCCLVRCCASPCCGLRWAPLLPPFRCGVWRWLGWPFPACGSWVKGLRLAGGLGARLAVVGLFGPCCGGLGAPVGPAFAGRPFLGACALVPCVVRVLAPRGVSGPLGRGAVVPPGVSGASPSCPSAVWSAFTVGAVAVSCLGARWRPCLRVCVMGLPVVGVVVGRCACGGGVRGVRGGSLCGCGPCSSCGPSSLSYVGPGGRWARPGVVLAVFGSVARLGGRVGLWVVWRRPGGGVASPFAVACPSFACSVVPVVASLLQGSGPWPSLYLVLRWHTAPVACCPWCTAPVGACLSPWLSPRLLAVVPVAPPFALPFPGVLVVGWRRGEWGADVPALGVGGLEPSAEGFAGVGGAEALDRVPEEGFPCRLWHGGLRGGFVWVGGGAGAELLEGVENVHPFASSRPPGPPHPAAELPQGGGRPPGEVGGGPGGGGL